MRSAVYAVAILPLVAVLFASCGGERDGIDFASGGSGSPAERAFEAFRADFIDGLWQIDPDWATSVGYYAYDDRLVVPHRCNRMVMFNSNLVHKTDDFSFRPGFTNRRINVTMLFGWRNPG